MEVGMEPVSLLMSRLINDRDVRALTLEGIVPTKLLLFK